jgi:hypothetical protein
MRILVVGVPRSGSTWVVRMLGRAKDTCLIHEPDNPFNAPFAIRAGRDLPGRLFPVLEPGDDAPDYETLWLEAFGSRGAEFTDDERARRAEASRLLEAAGEEAVARAFAGFGELAPQLRAAEELAVPDRPSRAAENVIVKSVYAPLAAEWVATRTEAMPVLITRDPRNVVSSWLDLGWIEPAADDPFEPPAMTLHGAGVQDAVCARLGAPPAPAARSRIERLAWFVALMNRALEQIATRHPEWPLVRHEALCADPAAGLRELAERLELEWTDEATAAVAEANTPGEGYATNRVADQLPEVWRARLTSGQIEAVEAQLALFPS